MKDKRAVCISASNIVKNQKQSTSYYISGMIQGALKGKEISCEILDLRKYEFSACTGCGRCRVDKRCSQDADFNQFYEKLAGTDYLFFISPCCAPIPAKLSMLLEKMEQMTALSWQKDNLCQPGMGGVLAGIISYGEGAPSKCKAMVNDTIASVLDTIGLRTVPFNSKWDTGISLPVGNEWRIKGQEGDGKAVEKEIGKYVEVIVQTSKSLHAIC